MVLGAVATRTDLARLTSGAGKEVITNSKLKYYFGIFAGAAYTSIVIWGFINLKWYIALIAFLGTSLGLGLAVNKNTLNTFVPIKQLVELITIILATIIWIF